ncbi:MAG: hypothetical protein ACLFWH_00880 [Actinomycetota bacterium]
MFLRASLTAGSLVIALTGVAAIDCATAAISVFTSEAGGVCATLGWPGDGIALWLGIALVTFAVIGLLATWVTGPVARGSQSPEVTLKENLARIPDLCSEPVESAPASILPLTRITRRVEAIEDAVNSESPPTREVTREWMKLLRDANDLHNRDELPTEEFKEINTRLLALFADPEDQNEEVAAAR